MKIRYKLLISKVAISVILLLPMLFMIQSAFLIIDYDDLKIQAEEVRNNVERMRYQIIGLVSTEERAAYVIADYALRQNILSFSIESLISGRNLNPLKASGYDVAKSIREISTKWEENKKLLPSRGEIENYLSYRRRKGSGNYSSLLATKILTEKKETGENSLLLRRIDSVISSMVLVETEYALFDLLVYSTIGDLIFALDNFENTRFFLVNLLLGVALLLSLVTILIFYFVTGRRVAILERTLNVMSSGNLNVRIPPIGNDEFGSLGRNVNTFVKTLQGRVSSFQTLMRQVGQTIEDTVDSESVESLFLKLAIQETQADGAGLYLVYGVEGNLILSNAEGELRPVFPIGELPPNPDSDDISALLRSRWINKGKTLVGQCATEGKAIFCSDVSGSDYSWCREKDNPLFVSSFILLPLRVGTSILGVLLLTSSSPETSFTPLEYLNMQSYSGLVAVTLENIYRYKEILEMAQLNREIDIASEMQSKLIPSQFPRLPGGTVSYMCRRIKGLNGDYFDVRDVGNGKSLITLCELTGRGVPAGMLMAMLRALIILAMSPEKGAAEMLNEINQKISQGLIMENYASMGVLVIDADGHYTFSSASRSSLHIFRNQERQYELVTNTGLPIGIDPDAEYEQKSGQLHPEDLVLMFTDGITDSQNEFGSSLGSERLLSTISTWTEESPEQIIESFQNFLIDFEGKHIQQDDQTMLVYKHDKEGWN